MTDRPSFTSPVEGTYSVRHEVCAGRGVQARCRACGHVATRTAHDLLERFWRLAEVAVADIFSRTSCPSCGSKDVQLQMVSSERPFPPERLYLSWEAKEQRARAAERFDAWIAERVKAERVEEQNQVAASYRAAKGR